MPIPTHICGVIISRYFSWLTFTLSFAGLARSWIFFALIPGLSMLGCRKSGAPTAASNEKTVEISGTVIEEDPTEFTQADESVQIGGVNIAGSSGYVVSVFAVTGSSGAERQIFKGVFPTRDFRFISKTSKQYLRFEIVKLTDGGRFGALLPPPTGNRSVKMTVDRTTSIASKLIEIVVSKAKNGDQAARNAIENHTISVADILIVAQAVRRTIDQQLIEKVPTVAIDIVPLASVLVQKSEQRIKELEAEGVQASEAVKKLSEKTYDSVFSANADIAPPGVLAYRTNHDLGTTAAATREVAYEAIKSTNAPAYNTVNAAFRTEADIFRTAATIEQAAASQQQVATNYASIYRICTVDNPTNCVSSPYTPPPPPAINPVAAPAVSQVSASTQNGSFRLGQSINIIVTFSEPVTVNGFPLLTLETGANDSVATYSSGSGTTTLTFTYLVKSGDVSTDLDYVSVSALALNGGSIRGLSGAAANLNLPMVGGVASLGGQSSIVIDTVIPVLTYVSTSPASPASDQTPDVVVGSSEPTTLKLYSDNQCTTAISQNVTAVAGNNTVTTDALSPNSTTSIYGRATDAAGNLSNCTVLTNYTHVPSAAYITGVTSGTANGTHLAGVTVQIRIQFSGVVNVNTSGGTPTLSLNTTPAQSATYSSGSGTSMLTFNYLVAGEWSSDLDYATTSALGLQGGTIRDGSAVNAILTLPAPGAAGSLGANSNLVIDGLAPSAGTFAAATGVTATGFILNWNAGSDGLTPQANLQYYLCSASALATIQTIAGCQGGSAVKEMDWTSNVLTKSISGRQPSVTYYYNVLVKDVAGNISLYPGTSQATGPDLAPTAGAFSSSTVVTSSGFRLNWTASSDDVTAASSLQYYVCSGASISTIDTVAECLGSNKEMDWTANTLFLQKSGLTANTTYYYNVLVRDAALNTSVYAGKSQTTSPQNVGEQNFISVMNSNDNSTCYLKGDPAIGSEWVSCDAVTTADAGYSLKSSSLTMDASENVWFGIGQIKTTATPTLKHKLHFIDTAQSSNTAAIGESISASNLKNGGGTFLSDSSTVVINGASPKAVSVGTIHNSTSPPTTNLLGRTWNSASSGSWGSQISSTPHSSDMADQPQPRALSAYSDSIGKVHAFFLFPPGTGYLRASYSILDTATNTWSEASMGAPLQAGSDNSRSCNRMSFLSATTDYVAANGRPHAVYYCQVIGGVSFSEIVYAYYNGTSWVYEPVVLSMITPPANDFDSKFGFFVHNNIVHLAYWDMDGYLQYMRRENGSWSGPQRIGPLSAGTHTPQIGVTSSGVVRVYFVEDGTTDAIVKVFMDTGSSTHVATVYTFQNAAGKIYLGNGVGIRGMPGNSYRP